MADAPTGTVTLLFSDIEGSTRLLQRTGEAYADLLAEHRRLLSEAFERHRGFQVDSEGDAFFVTFASAGDAAAAASEAQRALAGHPWPGETEIRVRIGLHSGEPRLIERRYVGLDVHQAARVMAAGHGGQVLLSESTRTLLDDRFQVRDLGDHRLKDLSGPQRLYQLLIEGLPGDFPPLKTLDNRPTNLPAQPNAFVGRVDELKELEALLTRDDVRLVTLTGTGGGGKTRLALQVAAAIVEQFGNGVFFVSLAPIRDWELVVPTVAQTLGLREQAGESVVETLTEYLRDKQMLLVLDNFEQVVAAAPVLAGLLASAPGLNVLATSRTPLRLSGERTYAVRPLALGESVQLFGERAHAAVAEFAVTEENEEAVAEICVRLEGLPLAIELAAPRVRALPPPALRRRLDERLKLLTGGAQDLDERQRTLRGTIEWSYDLLLAEEKTLFARLGVLVGGCRPEDAEALCDPDGRLGIDVLDGLGSLVEKSLLRQKADSDGEPRFWMLETIREYACELLDAEASDGLEQARRAHAEYYTGLAEQLDLESRTGDHAYFLARIDNDYANLRTAIEWSRETDDGELLLRLATALWGFWSTRGFAAEGRKALEDALQLSGRRTARALLGLCTLRILSGGSEDLLADAEEVLRACEELGDDFSLAQAWNLLGQVEGNVMGALGQAETAWRQAISYAERGGFAAERAESIGWLMVSAVFGPLPVDEGIERCKEFLGMAGDDPAIRAFCCCRACGAGGDERRVRAGTGAARRGHAGDHRPRANRLGREQRPGDVLRRDARRESEGGSRHAPSQLRHARGARRERLPLHDCRLSRARALRAGRVRARPTASAAPARPRPSRTTCSRRCSGARRARRCARRPATPTAPKLSPGRRCGSRTRLSSSTPRATRSSTWLRCSPAAPGATRRWAPPRTPRAVSSGRGTCRRSNAHGRSPGGSPGQPRLTLRSTA